MSSSEKKTITVRTIFPELITFDYADKLFIPRALGQYFLSEANSGTVLNGDFIEATLW